MRTSVWPPRAVGFDTSTSRQTIRRALVLEERLALDFNRFNQARHDSQASIVSVTIGPEGSSTDTVSRITRAAVVGLCAPLPRAVPALGAISRDAPLTVERGHVLTPWTLVLEPDGSAPGCAQIAAGPGAAPGPSDFRARRTVRQLPESARDAARPAGRVRSRARRNAHVGRRRESSRVRPASTSAAFEPRCWGSRFGEPRRPGRLFRRVRLRRPSASSGQQVLAAPPLRIRATRRRRSAALSARADRRWRSTRTSADGCRAREFIAPTGSAVERACRRIAGHMLILWRLLINAAALWAATRLVLGHFVRRRLAPALRRRAGLRRAQRVRPADPDAADAAAVHPDARVVHLRAERGDAVADQRDLRRARAGFSCRGLRCRVPRARSSSPWSASCCRSSSPSGARERRASR